MQLPLGDIVGILRRSLSVNDFPILLTLDLRTTLSPKQVIDMLQKAKTKVDSQIKELEDEIAKAESMSLLRAGEPEVLNEEGLPIKEIKEDVLGDEEPRRGVSVVDEVPERIYTMEEIDKMMDEAEAEEQVELQTSRKVSVGDVEDEDGNTHVTAVAGDGLDVGQVNGEELVAKLMDEDKKHYNSVEDIRYTDGDSGSQAFSEEEEDDQEEEEEEEDEFGRTRGYLIPPNLSKFAAKQDRSVKFAAFEQPATPSINPQGRIVKSALKKSSMLETVPSTAPVTSTSKPATMSRDIVERVPQQQVSPCTPSSSDSRIPKNEITKAHAR